jgi:hypothetical protein
MNTALDGLVVDAGLSALVADSFPFFKPDALGLDAEVLAA